MQFGTETGVMQALYGSRHAVATVDLPHRLGILAAQLPHGHPCTVDAIIEQQTFFPYYSPFLRTATYVAVRGLMASAGKSSIRVKCGACTNRVRPPKYFRSCPECNRENREQLGETYWRRLFQVPGVEVCPLHELFLESSNVRLDPLSNRHKYFSAHTAELGTRAHRVDPKNAAHRILLDLARRIDWVLRQEYLNTGLEFLHERYATVLALNGFATPGGFVRISGLRRKVIEFYGHKLLKLLQCELPSEKGDGWLGHLLRKPNTAVAPLRHLLLLTALNVDLENFFYPSQPEKKPESASEAVRLWPCLNPICERRGQSLIDEFQLQPADTNGTQHFVVRCKDCGFAYQLRMGEAPPARAQRIIDYGEIWKKTLRMHWADASITLRGMAKFLGVDPKTVKQRAIELNLPFPRKGKRPVTKQGLYVARLRDKTKELELHRCTWIDLGKKNPAFGVKQIRELAPALYAWLYRNDLCWLRQHKPQKKKPVFRTHVDWAKRDEELAGHIATIAAQIKNRTDKPQRVTVTAIGRALGKQSLFEAALTKLPLTRSVINSVLESGEEFAIRRVQNAGRKLRQFNEALQRWKLVRAAGLHSRLEDQPNVQAALDFEIRPPVNISIHRDRESRSGKSGRRPAFVPSRVRTWAVVSTTASH